MSFFVVNYCGMYHRCSMSLCNWAADTSLICHKCVRRKNIVEECYAGIICFKVIKIFSCVFFPNYFYIQSNLS